MAKAKSKPEPVVETGPPPPPPTDTAVSALLGIPKPAELAAQIPPETAKELDSDEEEFKKLRRDLPGVKGSSTAGILAISVGKAPQKNEFFRTHPKFYAIVSMVDHEVGMEKQYFAVTKDMVEPLASIGITVSDYALYLTVTASGAYRAVPSAR
jgi:hypothetical protein